MCFQSIRGSTIAASLSITTATVRYIAAILVIIISTIRKKSLGLSGARVLPLPSYNRRL